MTHRKPPSRLANAVAGLGAQVFSSLNSFLIIIISARFLELGVHGHFVFGVALCQIVLSLVRALCGETVVVLSTRGDDTTDDAAFSSAIISCTRSADRSLEQSSTTMTSSLSTG